MRQKILIGLIALFSVMGLVSAVAQPAMANGFGDEINKGLEQVGGKQTASANDVIKTIINALLFFIGVVAVIMIIWAGVQYTTSAGDSNKVTTAKNTIVYAVVGLIVAIFAYAIVNFVVSTFNTGGGGSNSNTSNTNNSGNSKNNGGSSGNSGSGSNSGGGNTGGGSSQTPKN
jgi:hypothetical protein